MAIRKGTFDGRYGPIVKYRDYEKGAYAATMWPFAKLLWTLVSIITISN